MRYFFDPNHMDSNPYTGKVPRKPRKYPSLWVKLGDEWVDVNNQEDVEVVGVEEDFVGRDVYTVFFKGEEYKSFGYTGSKPG
jgi:hypothetical protein